MSAPQSRAQLRWYWLCRQHGRVTFDMVRKLVPQMFDLPPDECQHSSSRPEPYWLIDMRNFKRDVEAGKNKNFYRNRDGLMLTEESRKILDQLVSPEQMRRVARLKQDDLVSVNAAYDY